MRKSLVLFFFLFLAFSCSKEKTNFKIDVQIDGAGKEIIYLAKRTLTGTVVVDSALPDKSGQYILRGFAEQPDFYVLYHLPRNYINLIVHPGDNFSVITNAAEFDLNYIIEGSKDSRLIQKLVTMQKKTLGKITEISDRYENARGKGNYEKAKAEADSTYDLVIAEHKKFSVDLIRQNPESLATLMALYQQLGKNQPVFDYKKDIGYYELVDSNLTKLYPDSEPVIDLNRKVSELHDVMQLETGARAPEIALPDSTGNIISLSSFRGKKVVVIFWASWSSASLNFLSEIADKIKEHHRNDLVLYEVSLDRTRESWIRYSQKYSGSIHVSDLKYWDSPVVDRFHIKKLPVAYLLDENGIIIAKGFEPDDLDNFKNF
jgi:hypothetical protein